jgi:formate dehydrogenase
VSDVERIRTHCRICEPQCGLIATVAGGRILGIRENRDHVFSQGLVCVKAAAAGVPVSIAPV